MIKKRILNERLAAIIASLRHGEMLFIADAGSGTSKKALYPLADDVEYIDLGIATGTPSFQDIVSVLIECGDFEGVIITEDMIELNTADYNFIKEHFLDSNIHIMHYIPEYYEMRDRCKAVVQTGDYGIHAQAILIAGYSSANIPIDWLKNGLKKEDL